MHPIQNALMPRKIKPKYGIDPVQEVPTFSFTDTEIIQLFETLSQPLLAAMRA